MSEIGTKRAPVALQHLVRRIAAVATSLLSFLLDWFKGKFFGEAPGLQGGKPGREAPGHSAKQKGGSMTLIVTIDLRKRTITIISANGICGNTSKSNTDYLRTANAAPVGPDAG